MKTKTVWVAFALICAAGCGGSGGGATGVPPGVNTPPPVGGISVENNVFTPSAKTVTAGTTIQWAWNSCESGGIYGGTATCVTHNVVFDDGTTSGPKDQGTYSRRFAAAGTYPYHCSLHGTAMSGTITVTP
jgi:plastocyanin